tara:strand:- start:45 stop:212 length:168 start_codon:yes stop_codon:yes gene_type:complete
MNVLAWVSALPAILWLVAYAYNQLGETPLALALLGVFLLGLAHMVESIQGDIGRQ